MAWIDYKKVFNFVPHSWINECMTLFGTEDNVRNFLQKNMEQCNLLLTSNGEDIGEVNVKRDISGRQSFTTVTARKTIFSFSQCSGKMIFPKKKCTGI